MVGGSVLAMSSGLTAGVVDGSLLLSNTRSTAVAAVTGEGKPRGRAAATPGGGDVGRVVDEVVHVKVGAAGAPEAFVRRGQLYVVREVLASWSARLPWWQGVAARALRGDAVEVSGSSALAPRPRTGDDARRGPAADEQVWRVVASRGFAAEPGTFELAVSPGAPEPAGGGEGAWRLVRVVD